MRDEQYSLMLVPDRGPVRSVRLNRGRLRLVAAMLGCTVAFGVWGVFSVYSSWKKEAQLTEVRTSLVHARTQHRKEVARLRDELEAGQKKLRVYARNLGQMQARLSRLDSLGSRLVEVAELDGSEFDFGLQPAFGGPRLAQPANAVPDDGVERLQTRLSHLDAQLNAIDYLLQKERDEGLARPHAWPSEGGWLSSHYGTRTDPFTGEPARHRGVDIANRFGAPVLAASRGVVTFAGKMHDFGYMIEVSHGYGYTTRYGHLSSVTVKVGDEVDDGQLIGRVGSTGRSTGPHLHYEVHRYGRHVNPATFLPRG